MKNTAVSMLMCLMLASCASTYNEIGSLNMLSNKHIDPNGHYQKLAVNVGTTKKEIKGSTADNIDAAINNVLNRVPGGEYITNVKLYVVNGDYLAVSGDVWGHANQKDSVFATTTVKAGKEVVKGIR